MPVLAGVDAASTYCYLLANAEHRVADTWAVHLLDANGQGFDPAVSQILHAGEAAWKDERDLRREGIELLGWAQFAPRAHLPFADHVHDFDSG